jgi:(p)ppGpp synthase/HD superfamily hydrolase
VATIEQALHLAAKAHEGQQDKDGRPYILHPLRLMAAVKAVVRSLRGEMVEADGDAVGGLL